MKKYKINNYRIRKLNKKNLVTTDHGSWLFLNDAELKKLKHEKINPGLCKKLKKAEVVFEDEKKIAEEMTKRMKYLFQGTSLHIVVPTLRCNYKCSYCHASSVCSNSKKFDMSKEIAKKTVDFIFQSPSNHLIIEFQGGEPLLNFDIIKYITNISKEKNKNIKKELLVTLVSNLSVLDKEKIDFIKIQNIEVCTSLDGPKKVHDNNRKFIGGNGSFEETIKKIKLVQDSNVKISALTTVTKSSLWYPEEIIDEYVKNRLDTIHIRFLNNLGYAKEDWIKIGYSPEEFIDFWKRCLNYIINLNKKGISIKERSTTIIIKKILDQDPDFLDLRNPCGAAIGQLLYNYDGKIYTCDEGRMVGEDIFKIGDVDQKFKEVLTCNETCAVVAASINDVSHCDYCAYKPYCGLCPVCNYAEHGNILAQTPATRRCKIFKAQFDYIFGIIQKPKILRILKSWI